MWARSNSSWRSFSDCSFCAYAFRHIDVGSDKLNRLSIRRKQRMAGGCEMSDCPIRKDNSELDRVVSFLTPGLQDQCPHPVPIVWMDSLPHGLTVRETLQRIKPPDSVAFL